MSLPSSDCNSCSRNIDNECLSSCTSSQSDSQCARSRFSITTSEGKKVKWISYDKYPTNSPVGFLANQTYHRYHH